MSIRPAVLAVAIASVTLACDAPEPEPHPDERAQGLTLVLELPRDPATFRRIEPAHTAERPGHFPTLDLDVSPRADKVERPAVQVILTGAPAIAASLDRVCHTPCTQRGASFVGQMVNLDAATHCVCLADARPEQPIDCRPMRVDLQWNDFVGVPRLAESAVALRCD